MSIRFTTLLQLILQYYAGGFWMVLVLGYDIECPRLGVTGPWVTPGTNCLSYYTCADGHPLIKYCPVETFFNTETKVCGRSGSCYEVVCSGRTDGRYLDATESCTRSYWCQGGRLVKVGPPPSGALDTECPSASAFAARLLLRPNRCNGKLDGRYSSDDDCSGYYICLNGIETESVVCSIGSIFDGEKCNEKLVQCSNVCSNKVDGLHSDHSTDCGQYVRCVGGTVRERLTCPADTGFNGDTCAPQSTFFCPGTDPCQSLQDGFHLESCENYFKCENSKRLFSAVCPYREFFNGVNCTTERSLQCKLSYFSKLCLGKDGFYTNHTSGCTSYYYCSRDGKKIDLNCPENYVFNGTVCVESNTFQCPIIEESCIDKVEGYYSKKDSLCQIYYYCLNGNKITYVCPNGSMFNGEKCVSSSNYTCPDDIVCNDLTGPCS